jgi:hypothetical protein
MFWCFVVSLSFSEICGAKFSKIFKKVKKVLEHRGLPASGWQLRRAGTGWHGYEARETRELPRIKISF